MDWIEFCDKAMIAPDTRRTDAELAQRFGHYNNGETITAGEVGTIREVWENRPAVTTTPVKNLRLPAEWFTESAAPREP